MLRGVLSGPSRYESLFLSLVHFGDDVSYALDSARQAFAVIGKPGS
jgi:glutamate-1-semialdehyde aminotransferase